MKNYAPKFLLIVGSVLVGLFCTGYYGLKEGIDLAGGTILVYETADTKDARAPKMDELVAVLRKRINPEGVKDIPIRQVGRDRVEIILPKATEEEVDEVKRKMTDTGSLEFRILASEKHDGPAIRRAMGQDGLDRPPTGYRWAILGETITGENPRLDKQGLTDPNQSWPPNRYVGSRVLLKGRDPTGADREVVAEIASNTINSLTFTKPVRLEAVRTYQIDYQPSKEAGGYVTRDGPPLGGKAVKYVLYKVPSARQDVTGSQLAHVSMTTDQQLRPAVGFSFNREGARRFGVLTREHLPEPDGFKYHLGILLDGVLSSAPVINSEIRDNGIIEMGSSGPQVAKEVAHLIEILRSGSLPATMKPTPLQQEKIGPTLGEDTIKKGITAIVISMLVVPIFMIVYYRFAGAVAVVALVLNMILLLGSMAGLQSNFTLPGLAGFALTIGMAVDANVLIFERMREEAERGAGVAQQIRNGFNRAWTTILDSHLTIFLSGLVLWFVGTEEIKGFALTLIIGMVWNLFTAVYVSRVIFEYFYQRGWLKKITMLKMMDKTNIDFIGPRYICITASVIVIALGLTAFVLKGRRMYNIDFTGGTLVTIRLDDQAPELKGLSESGRAEFVRQRAGALPDAAVESLNVGGQGRGLRFNIRTTETDIKVVEQKIRESFGKTLARPKLTVGPAQPIPKPDPKSAAAAAVGRFAGGWAYPLEFDSTPPTTRVAADFAEILAAHKVDRPASHFEVVRKPGVAAAEQSAPLLLRTDLPSKQAGTLLAELATRIQNDPNAQFENEINVGPTVAGETRNLAAEAIVASWLIIIAYLWFRFKSVTYGVAAVIALIHDVLITLGAVAISPYKIDLPMVAAFLTLIGFSVNDTIVIFDRIRELKGKTPHLTKELINNAINQTLSRTILTSLTAWIVVVIMYFFGGEGLAGFSFALVVGFLSGTYSTVYIATPILIDWIGDKPTSAARKPALAAREV
ncbi:MAG TPA: protein translocase subunit SecD [Isosphaeraceae bacterium]|jgi:SecD/SecF fusion protein|nr:protein translocase subunit SecD [Isosphaeraceae bacterium]